MSAWALQSRTILEQVANAANRLEMLGLLRVYLKLRAQLLTPWALLRTLRLLPPTPLRRLLTLLLLRPKPSKR
mgnify:CR=1 FL=1